MDRITRFLFAFILLGSWLFIPRLTQAASPTIRFVQSPGVQRAGDTIVVQVLVDSAGQNINAVQATLKYSSAYLEPMSVTQKKEFWPLWPETPSWDASTGTMRLVGGRPNGVVAIQAPFADITFRVRSGGLAEILLDSSNSGVYLNDNNGTKVDVTSPGLELQLADTLVPIFSLDATTTPTPNVWAKANAVHIGWAVESGTEYSYRWSTNSQDVPDESPEAKLGSLDFDQLTDGVYYWTVKSRTGTGLWSRVSQFRFQLDSTLPAPFTLTKLDPRQVGGHDVIAWDATDATSGIAMTHLLVNKKDLGQVQSPLQLKPEWRGSTITLVVRDQAGNERRVAWDYPGLRPTYQYLGWGILGVLVALGGILWWHRRRR